jgi:flagellar FliL protein
MPKGEEEEKKPEEPAAAPDGGSKKAVIVKWAVVFAILLLFIGIEVGVAVFFVDKLKEPPIEDTQAKQEATEKEAALKAQTEMGATMAAPIEVTVNISGEDGRYLKCGVQLEYDPSFLQLGAELDLRKARIKDIILDIMSSKQSSELMTNDGKRAIREQIVAEINAILPETSSDGKPLGKVRRSYFDSFIMQ